MTYLALSWGVSRNPWDHKNINTENYSCATCHKKIRLNYIYRMTCGHTFCAFCCNISINWCYICGFSGPPQLIFHDNTPNS